MGEKEKLLENAKRWFKRIFYRSAKTGKFVSKEFAEENPDTTIRETRKKTKIVRFLFYFSLIFFICSCSVVKKTFSKEKHKVEVSEKMEERFSESVNFEIEKSTYEFTSEEIKNVLSELNFSYFGENNDSAQIELTKNDKSISVKIKGKAVADFKTTEKEKTETNNQVAEISQKVDHLNYREIDKNHEIILKEKTKEEEKKKNKFDFPIWFWLIIGIIVVYLLINRLD